jgi:hypothetical protein
MAKRSKMIPKAGVTRNPKRRFAEGGKKSTGKKYACGGKMKK